jgi:hypothetical protein
MPGTGVGLSILLAPKLRPHSRPARIVAVGKAIALIGPLSDAAYFLNRAHTVTAPPGRPSERGVDARACILFAWSGVEAITLSELKLFGRIPRKYNPPLRADVEFLIGQRQMKFDDATFKRLRGYRNRIAHPNDTIVYTAPPASVAQEHFDYCVSLCRTLYSHQLLFEIPG